MSKNHKILIVFDCLNHILVTIYFFWNVFSNLENQKKLKIRKIKKLEKYKTIKKNDFWLFVDTFVDLLIIFNFFCVTLFFCLAFLFFFFFFFVVVWDAIRIARKEEKMFWGAEIEIYRLAGSDGPYDEMKMVLKYFVLSNVD